MVQPARSVDTTPVQSFQVLYHILGDPKRLPKMYRSGLAHAKLMGWVEWISEASDNLAVSGSGREALEAFQQDKPRFRRFAEEIATKLGRRQVTILKNICAEKYMLDWLLTTKTIQIVRSLCVKGLVTAVKDRRYYATILGNVVCELLEHIKPCPFCGSKVEI